MAAADSYPWAILAQGRCQAQDERVVGSQGQTAGHSRCSLGRRVLGCAFQQSAALAGSRLKRICWLRGLQKRGDMRALPVLSACHSVALRNQSSLEGRRGYGVMA